MAEHVGAGESEVDTMNTKYSLKWQTWAQGMRDGARRGSSRHRECKVQLDEAEVDTGDVRHSSTRQKWTQRIRGAARRGRDQRGASRE